MAKCIAPDEIKESDLMRYIEGTASQSVREHINRCPACAAEAEALARLERTLHKLLFRASCPSADALLSYVTRNLPTDEREHVARHLKECPHCAAEVHELKQAAISPASLLWQQVVRTARALVEAIAVPPRPELALALRGNEQRVKLYRAGELDIALGIEPSGPGLTFRIRGRVMKQGSTDSQIIGHYARLIRQGTVIARRQVDELGYFVFENIPSGVYELVLDHADADVVIGGIHLP